MHNSTHVSPAFKGEVAEYVKDCFQEAFSSFPELHRYPMVLEQHDSPGYTMRAQPVPGLSILRRKSRKYRVQMSNHLNISRYVRPAELPREVLIGWFAHELGHVVDYHRRSFWSLMWFVIGYILFATHRAGAERRADLFALQKGFGKELMATKRYILEQSKLPDSYKNRIRKYYLSPDELALLLEGHEPERVHF